MNIMFNSADKHIVTPGDIIARYMLQVSHVAELIERQYSKQLQPSPQGYYMVGSAIPAVIPNRNYYTAAVDHNNNLIFTQVTDFENTNTAIYDEQGILILNTFTMLNKRSLLYRKPTIPAKGISVLAKLIEYEISLVSPILSVGVAEDSVRKEFKPEVSAGINIQTLQEVARYILTEVMQFVGTDTWNYYYTKKQGINIILEKGPDHRVCEWYRLTTKRETDDYSF